jgi:hypothetical protein
LELLDAQAILILSFRFGCFGMFGGFSNPAEGNLIRGLEPSPFSGMNHPARLPMISAFLTLPEITLLSSFDRRETDNAPPQFFALEG